MNQLHFMVRYKGYLVFLLYFRETFNFNFPQSYSIQDVTQTFPIGIYFSFCINGKFRLYTKHPTGKS